MAIVYGKRMVASLALASLLVALLSVDSCMGDKWELYARTDPTCYSSDQIGDTRFGLSLKSCRDIANTINFREKVNYIWYAPKKMQWQDPSECRFYTKCYWYYPSRPGTTYERNLFMGANNTLYPLGKN